MARKYERWFITLCQEHHEYTMKNRVATGKCIVENKEGNGKLSFSAQNLKPEVMYKVYIITGGSENLGLSIGNLHVDEKGRGEYKWEFDPDNVGNTGKEIEAFKVVAILFVKPEGIIAPLVGYREEEITWKKSFTEFNENKANFQNTKNNEVLPEKVMEVTEDRKNDEPPQYPEVIPEKEKIEQEHSKDSDKIFAPINNENKKEDKEQQRGPVDQPTQDLQEMIELPDQDLQEILRPIDLMEPIESLEPTEPIEPIEPTEQNESSPENDTPGPSEDQDEPDAGKVPSTEMEENQTGGLKWPSERPEIKEEIEKASEAIHENFKSMAKEIREEIRELEYISAFNTREPSKKEDDPESIEYIFLRNPTVEPFQDNKKGILWIQITIKDLAYFPYKQWQLMNDPFILQSYKKYGHLIMGLRKEDKMKEIYIGVPDAYTKNKELYARRIGFIQFKCLSMDMANEGAQGYWLSSVVL